MVLQACCLEGAWLSLYCLKAALDSAREGGRRLDAITKSTSVCALLAAASAADLQKLDESIFRFFDGFPLEMGVLVHPQSGLLWPASLPGAFFCFFVMSLLLKNMIFDDFQ